MKKSRSVLMRRLKFALGKIPSFPKAEVDRRPTAQRKANTSRPTHWNLCVTVSIGQVGGSNLYDRPSVDRCARSA